ncbi:MAG: hypothetical protein CMH62_02825 [Nanoarchaeota archaeon]|nr:hypothetical protein [Nanoarchaeota archaeon]|tara:strand:- start:156 stop:749 length:594 start_codon:yes stop_codon:yes gene_type:complete
MAKDIFDVDVVDSLVRRLMREHGVLNLRDFDVEPYEIRPEYTTENFFFHPDSYKREIKATVTHVVNSIEGEGYNLYTLTTPLYEMVLNAFQHGNRRDPSKQVTISRKVNDASAEIAVIDEGGVIDPELIPFILIHREGRHEEQVMGFYEFAGRDRPNNENLGRGIFFTHTYSDNVQYFKSPEGGLVVHLTSLNPEKI